MGAGACQGKAVPEQGLEGLGGFSVQVEQKRKSSPGSGDGRGWFIPGSPSADAHEDSRGHGAGTPRTATDTELTLSEDLACGI